MLLSGERPGEGASGKIANFVTWTMAALAGDASSEVCPVELGNGRRYIGIDHGQGDIIVCLALSDELRERFKDILPEGW